MRNAFVAAVLDQYEQQDAYFLTGDLGFMALERVRDTMGSRFINVGVSEQNMVGVAAGLAKEGKKVVVYSIAPFSYARPFEQIRNDICFSKLPVCLVGNGGGYAYGYMGPTHHALEDCAAMCAIGVHVAIPAFDEDVSVQLRKVETPTYLRLGLDVRPKGTVAPVYAPWREVLVGEKGIILALGPLAGLAWQAFAEQPEHERPSIWAVTELPLQNVPTRVWDIIQSGAPLAVLEEHVVAGGLAMQFAYQAMGTGQALPAFRHRYAVGYPSGTYGSQNFHRKQCGLDIDSIRAIFDAKS